MELTGPSPSQLVRKQAWTEAHLVEGTEALLWPAEDVSAAGPTELPDVSEAVRAILSWVRPKVLRFQMTVPPQGLPDLILVSTRAVSGPARFVAHKSYQISTYVVCDPPDEVHIVERRDLFRVPVATRVTVAAAGGQWDLFSMDFSPAGLRVCPPEPLEVGTEVDLTIELGPGQVITVPAVVRHSQPYGEPGDATGRRRPDDHDGCPSQVGFQFLNLPGRVERQLAQFVAHHQRRLMPRVKTLLTVEYRCQSRRQFVEALGNEVSPGDLVFVAHEDHLPGDRLELKVRLGPRNYSFEAHAVSCKTTVAGGDNRVRRLVVASLDECGDGAEVQFRAAVRDLALEQWGAGPAIAR